MPPGSGLRVGLRAGIHTSKKISASLSLPPTMFAKAGVAAIVHWRCTGGPLVSETPSSSIARHPPSKKLEDVVQSVMDGYNGTVMAYGQTGAGKTHTVPQGLACTWRIMGVSNYLHNRGYNRILIVPRAGLILYISYT